MLTPSAFLQLMNDMPVVALKSVALLRQRRTDPTLSVSSDEIVGATQELLVYTEACQKMAQTIRKMPPVPVTDPALVEDFPL